MRLMLPVTLLSRRYTPHRSYPRLHDIHTKLILCLHSTTTHFTSPHIAPRPQLTFLLDDVGIPKSYRFMPGFGVHTFRLLNKAGKETLVKFHWVPKQGEGGGRERGWFRSQRPLGAEAG